MRSDKEWGYTLVELLVATVILGIISFALTESLVSGFNNTEASEELLSGSIDRQRLTATFVPDVQSMQTSDDDPPPCGSPLSGSDQVLKNLKWSDGVNNYAASYIAIDGKSKLVRRFCVNGDEDEAESQELAEITGSAEIAPLGTTRVVLRICPPGAPPGCPAPDHKPDYVVVATRRAELQ